MFSHHLNLHDDDAVAEIGRLAPHLARLLKIHHEDRPAIIDGAFEDLIADADKALTTAITSTREDTALMAAIRHYRGRINHLVALTDFADTADIITQMRWLTHAAEHALCTLTAHLAGEDNDHWFMLALGKMGAGELNYSSDIDLVIITRQPQDDYDKAAHFIKLTRRIINIMSTPTKDGIGWRIDLRLRPDPGATPIAMHHDAAMIYYESMARTWERAAFIRARPVAGNITAGQTFLDDLGPFIWRRYLDYTVLEDLKVMLRREPRGPDLLGYNIKNGFGGIRSIEFFTHAQQLIAGGREPDLRQRLTIPALEALAANNWIAGDTLPRLTEAYRLWRRLEHRIQMMGDAQTHSLPKSDAAMSDLAALCGADDLAAFKADIISWGDRVHDDTKGLMDRLVRGQDAQSQDTQSQDSQSQDSQSQDSQANGDTSDTAPLTDNDLALNWDSDNDAHTHETLAALGYTNTDTIIRTTHGWLAGRIPATRSPRARDLLAAMLPRLVVGLAETDQPDASFAAFIRLVEKLPAGLQLFSLMDSNRNVAEMIISIVTSAPKLADIISGHPVLADSLLYRAFWRAEDNWPGREDELHSALTATDDYEERLLILRRFCREWQFRTSVQLLQSQITPTRAGRDFSAIADIIIRGAITAVSSMFSRRFGHIPESGMTVLALGRLGAEEMTLLSDLDLIFIYDGTQDAVSEGGAKSIGITPYYTRFGQELINALSALTAEGRAYDIDMRLRPSGNKGPVAVHLDTFLGYQANDAWTWEHMALIKSRIIGHYGRADLIPILEDAIPSFIKSPRPQADLINDVADMRERLQAASPAASHLNIRSAKGGIMDIDFLTQMMQMMPAAHDLPICRRARGAASALASAGLISEDDQKAIRHAAKCYGDAIQLMRLLDMNPNDTKAPEERLPALLAKHFQIQSYAEFAGIIETASTPISALMKKYVCKGEKRE